MFRALRRVLGAAHEDHALPAHERRHLELAVAVLVHEARRADYAEESAQESDTAVAALCDLFGLERAGAVKLLAEGREKAQHLTSFYAPLTVIKREFTMPERIRLIEHLWRIVFAERGLDPYEDHYVRKIAHLLYVPNTDSMLARNRARA